VRTLGLGHLGSYLRGHSCTQKPATTRFADPAALLLRPLQGQYAGIDGAQITGLAIARPSPRRAIAGGQNRADPRHQSGTPLPPTLPLGAHRGRLLEWRWNPLGPRLEPPDRWLL